MPLRFGLALDFRTRRRTLEEHLNRHLELIQAAERYGFDSVWAGENYPTEPGTGHVPAPFLVLASLAPRTHLTLGTGVILLAAHNPLRLAYETAVLDQLAGGRFILGVGMGQRRLADRFGVDWSTMGDRADETLAALRALWSGAHGFQGRHLTIEGGIGLLPARSGGPPIWIGGAIRRSAERAADFGDAFYASTSYTFERVARQAERYRAALAARGKNPDAAIVSANRLAIVAPSAAEARDLGRRYVGPVLDDYAGKGSLGPELRETRPEPAELFEQLDQQYCLVGTPDEVAERVRHYAEAGVTHLQLRLCPENTPQEAALHTIQLVGERVLPRFS